MLIQDLLQRRNSKRSTAQHIWSMQSEDFCSSVARYRRVAAGGDSATPRRSRRGLYTPTVCCVAKFGSFFPLLTSCNSLAMKTKVYPTTNVLTEIVLQIFCFPIWRFGLFKIIFGQQNEGSNPFTRNKLIHLITWSKSKLHYDLLYLLQLQIQAAT